MLCKYCIENLEEMNTIEKKHCFRGKTCFLCGKKYTNEFERKWHLDFLPEGYIKKLYLEQYYISDKERYRKTTMPNGQILCEHFFKIRMMDGMSREFVSIITEKEFYDNKSMIHLDLSKVRYCYDDESKLVVDAIYGIDGFFCEKEFDTFEEMEQTIECPFYKEAKLIKMSNYQLTLFKTKEKRGVY